MPKPLPHHWRKLTSHKLSSANNVGCNNIIIFPVNIFLNKNTKKHPKMQKNNKTYQLVITNI